MTAPVLPLPTGLSFRPFEFVGVLVLFRDYASGLLNLFLLLSQPTSDFWK